MPDIASLNRNLSNTNTEGEPLGLAGFPLGQNKFKYSIGVLVAYADTGIDRGYELLYTNETSAGMSGGPILSRQGFLIGIRKHTSTVPLTKQRSFTATQHQKTGYFKQSH